MHIVAFTGHRTYDGSADAELRATINELYNQGARHFRVGMAEGFDLAAGDIVANMPLTHNDIILEACIPWPTFHKNFSKEGIAQYERVLQRANIVRYAGESYHHGIYHLRNDMLVEGADTLVAWWDGRQSGTAYTIKRAKKLGLNIKNIYPQLQLRIEI